MAIRGGIELFNPVKTSKCQKARHLRPYTFITTTMPTESLQRTLMHEKDPLLYRGGGKWYIKFISPGAPVPTWAVDSILA